MAGVAFYLRFSASVQSFFLPACLCLFNSGTIPCCDRHFILIQSDFMAIDSTAGKIKSVTYPWLIIKPRQPSSPPPTGQKQTFIFNSMWGSICSFWQMELPAMKWPISIDRPPNSGRPVEIATPNNRSVIHLNDIIVVVIIWVDGFLKSKLLLKHLAVVCLSVSQLIYKSFT